MTPIMGTVGDALRSAASALRADPSVLENVGVRDVMDHPTEITTREARPVGRASPISLWSGL